jgi:thiamine-phosphate pyrophosphorylase
MRLIIISPPENYPDEPRIVARMLRRTPADFHLRKPALGEASMVGYLKRIPADLHRRIMVHGCQQLVDRFDLKGMHVTEKARRQGLEAIRRFKAHRPECCLSTVFHRIADMDASDDRFDYCLLSPIFDSISKKDRKAAFDHAVLKNCLDRTDRVVIALGGIHEQCVDTAAALGFKGVAVLGAVWRSADPEAAAERLSSICGATE